MAHSNGTARAIATSEQAMPLPRDSQPAARETRAVHTADIHISEPTGTDIWVDVRIGMAKPDCSIAKELARMEQEQRREYGLGPSNPSTLFDGVVPVIFEQHGCPKSVCNHVLAPHIEAQGCQARTRVASHTWCGMDDRCPGTFGTNFLHLLGHAPSDVSGVLPHRANT